MRAALGVIAVALVFASGCAQKDWIDRTLVTENVTGFWSGSTEGSPVSISVQLELRQQGAKVTGEMKVPQPGTYSLGSGIAIAGSVSGDLFTFHDQRGTFSGELTVGGDNMVGKISSQWGAQRASLHRGSASPQESSQPPRGGDPRGASSYQFTTTVVVPGEQTAKLTTGT